MENKDLDAPAGGSAAERAVERPLAQRRAAYAEEVRRLVAAAFVLIERSGELEPRVGDIVREAGLSNQAFYRHFPSKQALLVAVLDEGVRILAGYLAHRMEAAAGPSEAIREWLRGMLEQAVAPAGASATRPFVLARTRLAEAHPAEVAASERQLTAPLRLAIRAAASAGELPGADPEPDAEMLYQLVEFAVRGLRRGADISAVSP
jgi:AcrR family transcriptional regulator